MPQHTVTNSNFEEYGLTLTVAIENKKLTDAWDQAKKSNPDAPEPTLWTNDSYAQARFKPVFTDYAVQRQDQIMSNIIAKWPSISQANRDEVANLLGFPEMVGQPANLSTKYLGSLGLAAFKALPADEQDQLFVVLGV